MMSKSGYPAGTVRKWGDTEYRKQGDGNWLPVSQGNLLGKPDPAKGGGKTAPQHAAQLYLFSDKATRAVVEDKRQGEIRNARLSDLPQLAPAESERLLTAASKPPEAKFQPTVGYEAKPVANGVQHIPGLSDKSWDRRYSYNLAADQYSLSW